MPNNSRPLVLAVGLLALGAAGYAYLNPAFAATCKTSCGKSISWVSQQAASAQTAFEKTTLYASFKKALQKHDTRALNKQRVKAKAAEQATREKAPPLDMTPAAVLQRERVNWSVGQKIANDPANAKNMKALGFSTPDQMASHIDRVIGYASPSTTKTLSGGRTVYWDERTRCVVVVNANTGGGTMFKPQQGYPYFKDLK